MTTIPDHPESRPYTEPVSRFLSLGKPQSQRQVGVDRDPGWPDYPSLHGIGPGHVDELIRMACDPELSSTEVSPSMWGPVHAWRTLGRLRAEAAVLPLLGLAEIESLDDWAGEELPVVLGLIGGAAIGPIADFLGRPTTPAFSGGMAAASLTEIAGRYPQYRADCLSIMETRLRRRDHVDIDVNAAIVSGVLDLKAVEIIDAVRDAFERDAVDLAMAGDIEDVEIDLGLRQHRATPAPRNRLIPDHLLDRLRPLLSPPAQPRKKVGRNDPCPCGSGRKYKKCCGSSTNNGPAPV